MKRDFEHIDDPRVSSATVVFFGNTKRDPRFTDKPVIDPTPEDHAEVLQAWNLAQARAEMQRPKSFGK